MLLLYAKIEEKSIGNAEIFANFRKIIKNCDTGRDLVRDLVHIAKLRGDLNGRKTATEDRRGRQILLYIRYRCELARGYRDGKRTLSDPRREIYGR